MIDLIDECSTDLNELGYSQTSTGKYGLLIGKVNIETNEKAQLTGFDKGSYMIFNCPLLHKVGDECISYDSDEV